MLLLIIATAFARQDLSGFNPAVGGWYQVSPQEIDFCKRYGGSEDAGINQDSRSSIPIALSQITLTLQAKRTSTLANGQRNDLYEVSYYIEPVSGEVDFEVQLLGEFTPPLDIPNGRGRAKSTEPGMGFYANYHTEVYSSAKIKFGNDFIEVPVISSGRSSVEQALADQKLAASVSSQEGTSPKGISVSGFDQCIEDFSCEYYFLFLPVGAEWRNQDVFNALAYQRMLFFKDISKFKSRKAGAVFAPISFASENCNLINIEENFQKREMHDRIQACADKYARSLGIGYERAVGLSGSESVEGAFNGYAYFTSKAAFARRGGPPHGDITSVVAHEWGHTYQLCDEYKYQTYSSQENEITCKNDWPTECPKADSCSGPHCYKELCRGNFPVFRDYSGPPLPSVCRMEAKYSVMGVGDGVCGFDKTGGYEALG
ncbi:hypothetical protein HYU14_00795 [Candidatus Woesearchaeota archaeon]|nr:hypothetical protein [Candidatus Woesearchaeota archaeon]